MRKEAGKSRKKQKRNEEQMDIARKKKAIICLGVVLLLSLNAYFTRPEKVRSNYWKNTNEKGLVGEHGNVADFLWFSQDGWQYEFPIVKRNGKVKGVVCTCLMGRLVVYSFENSTLGFYVSI